MQTRQIKMRPKGEWNEFKSFSNFELGRLEFKSRLWILRIRLNFRVKNPQNQPRNAHYLRYSLNAVLVKFISVELEIGLFTENLNFRSKTPQNNYFC